MIFRNDEHEIEVVDDQMYNFRSTDNQLQYGREYLLGENHRNSPCYGIIVKKENGVINSCIVSTNGCLVSPHTSSVLVQDKFLFISIGDSLCCFEIPSLILEWHKKVDTATCLGIYLSPESNSIISHGELEISKVSLSGDILWSVCGKDIFTEGFKLFSDHIEVVDFNHEKYRIGLSTGIIEIQNYR